jgi:carboxymethylenebutenolidase
VRCMVANTPLTIHEPAGDAKGGIVVVQEAFGVNDHIDDVTRRVAEDGWLAVAPHLFHRTGDPKLGYDDVSQVMPHMGALTAAGILDDIDAALAYRVGGVGFCMVTAPPRSRLTFYGGGLAAGRFGFDPLIEEASRLRAPWLGLYGDLDQGIPVADVERLRTAAASSGQTTEVVRYPDAGHGFHCDQRSDFDPPSAGDAWQRTLAWFDRHLST